MKAIELRIGNYVSDDFFHYQVKEIKTATIWAIITHVEKTEKPEHCYEEGNSYHLNIPNIKPITLTEDWLKKFGFKIEFQDENDNNIFKKENLKIIIKKSVIYFGIWNIDWFKFKKKIKYVHQLQNLYFILKEKELNETNQTK